jgi:hypothetical protein
MDWMAVGRADGTGTDATANIGRSPVPFSSSCVCATYYNQVNPHATSLNSYPAESEEGAPEIVGLLADGHVRVRRAPQHSNTKSDITHDNAAGQTSTHMGVS